MSAAVMVNETATDLAEPSGYKVKRRKPGTAQSTCCLLSESICVFKCRDYRNWRQVGIASREWDWVTGRHRERCTFFSLQTFCAFSLLPLKKKSVYGSFFKQQKKETKLKTIYPKNFFLIIKIVPSFRAWLPCFEQHQVFMYSAEAHPQVFDQAVPCFLFPLIGFLNSRLVNEVVFS